MYGCVCVSLCFFFFEQVYLCIDLSVWMCLCMGVFVCGCVCVHLRKEKKIRREVTEFIEHGEKREKKEPT